MNTHGQGFVQLPPRPQGQSQQPFQPGFGNMNHAGPTPPPHPPMGQMPTGHPGGQMRPVGDHQGAAYARPHYGRSGSHDLSSPTLQGMSQHHSPQGRSARRARPVVHNALERRTQPRTQICDLRTRVTSEHEARNALSSYVVWTIKKDGDTAGIDHEGNYVVPTWARAKHSEDTGVSQEEAARRVCDLQLDTEPVSDKKARLATQIQDQIQYAQEQLEDQEEYPESYCYELKQFHQSIKRVEVSPYFAEQHFGEDRLRSHSRSSRSHGRYSSKDKRNKDKYKKGFSLYETPKYRKPKTKTQKQTDSITAYFRRKPRDGVNCLQMWEDYQNGNDDWDRPRTPPRFPSQQPFNGTGQHPAQQGGLRQQQPIGNHQAGQMPPNFGQQGAQHNMPQQAGVPSQQQFGHQTQGGFGQNQPMTNMPRGVQQHPGAPNQQQAFPPQAQYAQNQGQHGGVQPNQRFQQGDQGFAPAGQHPQARPGQSGAPQAFQQGVGVQNGPMGRGNMPNQGIRPQAYNAQQKNVPPVPPMHGRPTKGRGPSPRVFPTSPRSSRSSFSDRDSDSDSDTSIETPASSVGSRGRRSNRQPKASRDKTRSRGRDHKVYGVPSREHSKAAPYPRPVSPPTYHPRSAMRTPSRSGLRQQEFGRTTPRHFMDDSDQFARQRLNSFDHEMLGRKMTGDFSHRSPPRRAYSDHFEYMPRESFPRRTVLSDFDQPLPRRPMMDGFDDPRTMRGGNGMDFRRVSPGSARRAMFGEDDLDRLSEDLDGLRLDRGFGGADRRAFVGPDRLERGFRDRFRGREYYGDDDLKHTRFADGAPGLNYGRPTGRVLVNDGYRTLGRGRAASYWGE